MTAARLHCFFVLLLYLKVCHGQQPLSNNQNIGVNNGKGLQQTNLQRTPNNVNPIANGGLNINCAQQSNLQPAYLQQSPNLSGSNQGNLQQSCLPSNLQSQSAPVPQNNLQITKIGFTPVSNTVNNPYNPAMQLQNGGVNANVQVIQPQNIPFSNTPVSQAMNAPISTTTLADLLALKGQSPLLSFLNSQNVGQPQQSQAIVVNTNPSQNQLTDVQKQFLIRSIQAQTTGQNEQGLNFVQAQSRMTNVDNQQAMAFRGIQGTPQQAQAIVTPLGNQPPYITVQAQPLTNYIQNQPPQQQVTVEEEPSLLSLILSELGPQYAIDSGYLPPKKGSKTNLKSLIPLIINMLKEKNNCGCRNCGCPNNACQNNACQNNSWPNNVMANPQMAQIFGGYSTQMKYGQGSEDTPARIKKDDDEESRNNDKERKINNKKTVAVESEEVSEEDDSEYVDDE